MQYEDIHRRYGNHVAKRVQQELSFSEFSRVNVGELVDYLVARAEIAHKEYHTRIANPFIADELGAEGGDFMNNLYQRWCEAEELAYLLTIAEDVCVSVRAVTQN